MAVYKCTEGGVYSYFASDRVQYRNIVAIDNRFSLVPNLAGTSETLNVYVSDSHIYGETEIPDCFVEDQCLTDGGAHCVDKTAVLIPYISEGGKALFPKSPSALPLWSASSVASFFGSSEFYRVTFEGFG
mmetsp:Transcript_29266/g.28409  ORF Transcript_29266/g.28409 Transcript_29266/m.28409 type:complete len:130 (-) Transcript_29266:945-1334(-)